MSVLRDYLRQRKADLRGQLRTIVVELSEVRRAERALATELPRTITGVMMPVEPQGRPLTLKQMAVSALRDQPNGATVQEIIRLIAAKHHVTIQRPSLSPQLSRLAFDGVLGRAGMKWFIAQKDMLGEQTTGNQPAAVAGEEEALRDRAG